MSNTVKTAIITILFLGKAFVLPAQQADSAGTAKNPFVFIGPTPEEQKKIDAAFAAMDAVQKAGAYVESLADLFGNRRITLPVGIKKGEYELVIQKIKHNRETGKPRVYATCAFRFKDNGQKMAFEGSVDVEGQKGLGTSGHLGLIAPVKRDMGKEAAIIFKPGTKANFGCGGIESFYALLELVITSEKVVAVDRDGKPTGRPLATSFDAGFFDFDNYVVSANIGQHFMLKGLKDIIFSLQGATLDQSDTLTPALVQFPEGYFQNNSPEETRLWKGLAISEASIALPAIFKKSMARGDFEKSVQDSLAPQHPGMSGRIGLTLRGALIDENGFTGGATANNIINSEALDKASWDISVDDFSLNILKGQVTGFGFGGELNVPPLGSHSLLPYMATFNPSVQEYEFQVNMEGDYNLPVLKSKLSLNETSTIEILFKGTDVYPTLNASGILTINAPLSKEDTNKKFVVPDITFENMKISRGEPYFEIGTIGVAGDLRPPEIAGFQVYLEGIRPFKNEKGEGLAFGAGVKLNTMFGGEAGIQLYGDYANWKFSHVQVDKINVSFESPAFSVNGGVEFKNGDALYGTGFRGDLDFRLIEKFKLQAVGVFGKKDGYRYFLTDVYLEVPPSAGIMTIPGLSFYGFGGGLYRRMQQSIGPSKETDFGKSLSGINYVPDKGVNMGFMATTRFGLSGVPAALNALVGFEMQFNNYGGLNFVQLRGEVSYMNDPAKWGKLADNINERVKEFEKSGGKIKLSAKSDLKVPECQNAGFLTGTINARFDLANKSLSADISAYLNAGFVKGVGPNGRMGWASAYFSEDKWYTYVGTPEDRLGIETVGLSRSDGYFMIGDDIPELPLPPDKVLKNFTQGKIDKLSKRSPEALSQGSGIAFGLSFGYDFKATLTPFYASIGLMQGGEFLLKNYGEEAYCQGSSSTLGINGWYARAQAWAWVEADIGMEAKVFGKERRFKILDVSAGALLTGAGPNPIYFTGTVGGHFNVMGGLISGRCDFDFEIGDECIVKGGSPFGEKIIAQLTPAAGDKGVNVFASPQALFNIPVGLELEIDEEGNKVWYQVTLEEFTVYDKATNKKIEGAYELAQDGRVYMLDPSEPFPSHKELTVYAKVGFKRKLNGQWTDVKGDDGKPVFEEGSVTFTTGERPKKILPEHVKYSYPQAKQYNFYKNEYSEGYILVSENYSYLFSTEKPEGFDQVLRYTNEDGKKEEKQFTYTVNSAGNDIRLEINYPVSKNLVNDEIYNLAIVNVPQSAASGIDDNVSSNTSNLDGNDSITVTTQQAEGTLDMLEEKEIFGLHFRTSSYNTFDEKMAAISNYSGVAIQEYPHVYNLVSNIYDKTAPAEVFDRGEHSLLDLEGSMVRATPDYEGTSWYTKKVKPLIYDNGGMLAAAGKSGMQPPTAPGVSKFVLNSQDKELTKELVESSARHTVSSTGAMNYRAGKFIDRDFMKLQDLLANRVVKSGEDSKAIAKFLAEDNIPDLTNGDYKVKVEYILPGKNITTSTVERTIELKDFIPENEQ